jgi:co-chaperonin GroES (HSP10)
MVLGFTFYGEVELMLKPIRNKVLVKHHSPDEIKTESGIIIPLKTGIEDDNRQLKATVLAVADGVTDVKEGDTVQVRKWAGEDYDGCKLLDVREVVGVWE